MSCVAAMHSKMVARQLHMFTANQLSRHTQALVLGQLLQVQAFCELDAKTIPSYKQLKQFAAHVPHDSNAEVAFQTAPASHAAEVMQLLEPGIVQLDVFWKSVRETSFVIWAKSFDLSWAFYVFKSMNETGRPLSEIDKLKALVMNCWKHDGEGQRFRAEQWDKSKQLAGGETPFKHVIMHMAFAHGKRKDSSLLDYMVRQLLQYTLQHWSHIKSRCWVMLPNTKT